MDRSLMRSFWRFKISSIFKVNPYDTDRPLGLAGAFKSGASDCAAKARELKSQDSTPQYILTFHALELALKAYLAFRGISAETLKKQFSHNLTEMHAEAKRLGLTINVQDVTGLLKWTDEFHGNGLLKYGLEPYQHLPQCSELLPIVDEVLSNIPVQATIV